MDFIVKLLKDNADENYANFHSKLVPTIERERILGVRTPIMRTLAKNLMKDKEFMQNVYPEFLKELPHYYYDEMILHGELISHEKDFDRCIALVEDFLPHIDNWAVCDLLSPKVFSKNKSALFDKITAWLKSDEIYTVRFGIDMMIKYFVDDSFDASHLDMVKNANGDDYYIKMAQAWYYSVALVKQYDVTLNFLKICDLNAWTKRKSLQKARESFRLSKEQKDEIKAFQNTIRV